MSCPINLRIVRQFSTGGASFDPSEFHKSRASAKTPHSQTSDRILAPSPTKRRRMRRRIRIQGVDTDDLVIRPGRQVFPVRRKPHRVNRPRMVAHRRKLPGLARILGGSRVVDGLCRPYPNVSICICQKAKIAAMSSAPDIPQILMKRIRRQSKDRLTSSSCNQTASVRRYVATIHLKVFSLPCPRSESGISQFGTLPEEILHVRLQPSEQLTRKTEQSLPPWVSQTGLMICIAAVAFLETDSRESAFRASCVLRIRSLNG